MCNTVMDQKSQILESSSSVQRKKKIKNKDLKWDFGPIITIIISQYLANQGVFFLNPF